MPLDDRDNPHQGLLGTVAGAMGASNSAKARVRGGTANQTIFTQDGFDMRDQMPTMKSSAAYEILTGGHGGESPDRLGRGGQPGDPRRIQPLRVRVQRQHPAQPACASSWRTARPATPTTSTSSTPRCPGPIIKDKLWFFVNWDTNLDRDTRSVDPSGFFPARPAAFKMINKGTVKLTWQITPRNKLTSLTNFDFPMEWNRKGDFGVNPEAQERRQARRLFTGLIWDSLLSDNLMLRSQAGLTWFGEHIFPELCVTDPGELQLRPPGPPDASPRTRVVQQRRQPAQRHLRRPVQQPAGMVRAHASCWANTPWPCAAASSPSRTSTARPRPAIASRPTTAPCPLQEQTFFSNDPRPEDPRSGSEVVPLRLVHPAA